MRNTTESEEIAKLYRFDQIAEKYDGFDNWDEGKIKQYRHDGYLAIENVLTQKEVNRAIDAINQIIFDDDKGAKIQFTKPQAELKTDKEREIAVRKISEFVEVDERLNAIAYHPEIQTKIEEILGEEPILAQDMALLKPPFEGGEKPWHQDMAFKALSYTNPVIGVWVALDEVTHDNGCMHVIPGSHAEGATPHYFIRDLQICDTHISVERDVTVPLKPGGILFFHGLLKHGTPPNHSPKRRRALQFHYVGKSALKLSPKEYKRVFTNEMSGAEC
ncbi:phytanoyl-CoA dioxygenase family protein [Bacillaceae bacterium SIJ1]|uniref:phytanoyl-CoA dioxygenase family protein n=1 Tax=Litoribacterium kuwaitense TaxID=1398745 RepID=UPI0013EDC50E|nr:phytanoyl-CoA dioxygenase family protein [Litoribacterium kuwaitense]NGP44185.1 phytanoyl-CoA dioxygenase family protein [Litoribacterium kuwaitense]